MRQKPPARVCMPSPTRLMEVLHTTCPTVPTRPTLHSWPGQETFDDVDVDDFVCDEDDLPGLRMMPVASINVRFHEKASGSPRRTN